MSKFNVSSLNECFNINGPDVMEGGGQFVPCKTNKEYKREWYLENQDRLKAAAAKRLDENRDEINRKRRERRNTEPYRSEYLARQRERRRKKSGSV